MRVEGGWEDTNTNYGWQHAPMTPFALEGHARGTSRDTRARKKNVGLLHLNTECTCSTHHELSAIEAIIDTVLWSKDTIER